MSNQNTHQKFQSPYKNVYASDRSTDEGFSPIKVRENEYLQQKLNDMSFRLSHTQQDLELANFKTNKQFVMEEKVEMVLKHNVQLLDEVSIITQNFNQKKTESEVWKQKYDNQLTSNIQMKAQYELEIRKYSDQNSALKDQLSHGYVQNYRTVEETSSRANIDKKGTMQQLKLAYNLDMQVYQEQVRKLREILEQREHENGVLNQKIQELKNVHFNDSKKLMNDKEKINLTVSQIELDHHKMKEYTRQSTDRQYSASIENLTAHYNHEMSVLQGENGKLKSLLDLKQQEIQKIISYNKGVISNSNGDLHMYQIEIQNLKEIIYQINQQKENELSTLKERLTDHHVSDLHGLQFYNDNQQEALTSQIMSLTSCLNDKQYEIKKQLSEKQRHKDNYYKEIERLNKELEQQQYKRHLSEVEREKNHRSMTYLIQCQHREATDFQTNQDSQIKQLEADLRTLMLLIEQKTHDLDCTQINHKRIKNGLQADIEVIKNDYQDLELDKQSLHHQIQIYVDNTEMKSRIKEDSTGKKFATFESSLQLQQKEIQRVQDTLMTKDLECVNTRSHLSQKEEEISCLQQKIDILIRENHELDRKSTEEKEKLKERLDEQHCMVIEHLQQSHANQLALVQQQFQKTV